MMPPLPLTPLKSQTQLFSLIPNSPFSTLTPLSPLSTQTLTFPRKPISLPLAISINSSSYSSQPSSSPPDDYEEEHVVGDCLVFEEGIFEDPYLQYQPDSDPEPPMETTKPIRRKPKISIEAENLVPDKWKEVQAELNITKKERRKLAQELEFQSRIKMKKKVVPLLDTEEYLTFREAKMAELKQVVLDNPSFDSEGKVSEDDGEKSDRELGCSSSGRVAPRNPRVAVYKGSLDDITEFFNSGYYEPGEENAGKNSEGRRKLFTKEEKSLMNKRTPNLAEATCKKWLPLHSLAASGEFYLVDALLKYNVDINAIDKDGLTALHKAILCKKMAVMNYLLRESANPFVRDKEGATLMHYAVQTASSPTIKILLLYNVDINLADDDGWTPLHLAVQTRRTDIVKLLLIKGADKSLKNRDGLTPLALCLYSGRHVRTYELIKLLKQLPKSQQRLTGYQLI